MITESRCRSLIDQAIKRARRKVDAVEVSVSASNVATSRFAVNGMTQNQSPERVELSVRVIKDGRQSRLSGDQLSPAGINRLVDNAIGILKYLEPDAEIPPLVRGDRQPKSGSSVNRFDRATARFSAQDRAQAVAKIVGIARQKNLTAAGVVATGCLAQAIGNSSGLFRFHQETSAECSITMKHVDSASGAASTGWSKEHSVRVADIDVEDMARRTAQKALSSANPIDLPAGKYTVILEPPAVLDLLGYLWGDFGATTHIDKLSCFLDKVGQKLLGDNITIEDDCCHLLQAGAPFDGEGMTRHKVTLVQNGVIKNLVYGRRSALKLKAACSGHGLPEPSSEGEFPVNIVLAGGGSSLDDMIRSTERGVLLTRVWYVREVDPTAKIVTGMTRDGTFLVENGAIKCGVKNFRFNQGLIEMLNNVVMLGVAGRTAGEESFPAVVPAMKVDSFNFASVTSF